LLPMMDGRPAPPGAVASNTATAAAPPPPFLPGQTPPEPVASPQSADGPGNADAKQGNVRRKPVPGIVLPGNQSGGNDGEGSDSIGRYAPPVMRAPGPRKPVALRPAQLTGDRDYVIYVECREDSVVLYPAQRIFPLAVLTRGGAGGNPFAQAVEQMIDRRQSAVPAGGIPYRPQVCFLVRPDSMRAYHTAYPTLDGLSVPKVRQNLQPEDDVLAIVTGR
jgi:hypothetical protein